MPERGIARDPGDERAGGPHTARIAISHLLLPALLAPAAYLLPLCLLACSNAAGPRGQTAPALAPSSALDAAQDETGAELVVLKHDPGPRAGSLLLTFSRPVDPASLEVGRTVHAYQDADPNPGGVFLPLGGQVELDATGRVLSFVPDSAPPEGHEVRLVLTSAVRDAGGAGLALQRGASGALSFARDLPDAVCEVRAIPRGPGAATAAAGAGDDHADGPGGATPLLAGVTARGLIGVAGDKDWFLLELRAGDELTARTITTGDTTLALYAPDGTTLLASNDDDPQGGRSSRVTWRATSSGEHLLEVGGYGTRTPEYGLEALIAGAPVVPGADDHGGAPAAATPLRVGGGVAGAIEVAGDEDWFALALQTGQAVELATVTTADTVLRAYAPDGATLLGRNDDDPQGGRASRLRLTAGAAGTYYAAVTGYGRTTPAYRLEARPVPVSSGETLPDPDRFTLQPDTDPWHIDFALRRDDWLADLRAHGMRSDDPGTDALLEARVIDAVLSWTSRMYERGPDGASLPRGFRISFTRNDPPGTAGSRYSREAVGGRHQDGPGTLGVSWLDYGNRRKEDNATAGQLGIFSASINGRVSTLSPALQASDRRYLDGSYRLGDGSSSDDRRFQRVREAAADWGHALAVVVAHEVGHSVGLDHDEADADSIMHPTLSRWMLSDPATAFSPASAAELERSLGRHPAP